MNVSPLSGYRAGGSIITVTVADTCGFQLTDTFSCIFDGISVAASYENETAATCVMPLINSTGIIPFVFDMERGENRVTTSMDFESCECTNLYTDCTQYAQFTSMRSFMYTCVSFVSVLCKLPTTPFISPNGGNMLGGTAITITIASQCLKEITGTPQCVLNGTQLTPAVDDSGLATSGKHFFCSIPMFDRSGRISFEFRAPVKANSTLSEFDSFYLSE